MSLTQFQICEARGGMVHESTERSSCSKSPRRTPNICSSSWHSPQGQKKKGERETADGCDQKSQTIHWPMGADLSNLQTLALNGKLANMWARPVTSIGGQVAKYGASCTMWQPPAAQCHGRRNGNGSVTVHETLPPRACISM